MCLCSWAMIRRADLLIIMSRSRSFGCGEFERACCQRKNRQIEVETGCFGSGRCRDEQKKWGQCHPVSLTMQGWEGISLTYITLSAASPHLTSPSPPVPLHHPRCSPSGITKLMVAYLFFQHFGCSFSSPTADFYENRRRMLAWRFERDYEKGHTMKRDRNAKLDAQTWSQCVKSVQKGGKGLVVGVDESLFIVHPCWVGEPGPAQQSAASLSVCVSSIHWDTDMCNVYTPGGKNRQKCLLFKYERCTMSSMCVFKNGEISSCWFIGHWKHIGHTHQNSICPSKTKGALLFLCSRLSFA